MNFFFFSNRRKVVSVIILALIALSSFLYTQFVLENLMEQERSSVELWAKAIEYNSRELYPELRAELQEMIQEVQQNPSLSPTQKRRWTRNLENAQNELANAALEFIASELIIGNRFEIPSVVTDTLGNIIFYNNIDERRLSPELVAQLGAQNPPIQIPVLEAENRTSIRYVYYGQSAVAQSLRFFPYVQFGLLAIFLTLIYVNLSNIRRTEQSNLWVGMAKEAAHQLGTPLSSMFGWIELMRSQSQEEETINILHELEEDVRRLQSVADRFNKIGSGPELKLQRVEPVLNHVIDYMERRLPRFGKNVNIRRNIDTEIRCDINTELFSWAIENLIKNALDAIDSSQEDAFVELRSFVESNQLVIEIEDSGRGIEKRFFEEIFQPGYSTKKRGWGLGLSLTRRIIEKYHGGRVYIQKSAPGQGTTFRILIPLS